MANIAEGFERSRPGEFHQALSISKASCAEVRSHLYAAFDLGYLAKADFERLKQQAEEAGRIAGDFRATVQRRRDKE
jgi:four helix bundle protein